MKEKLWCDNNYLYDYIHFWIKILIHIIKLIILILGYIIILIYLIKYIDKEKIVEIIFDKIILFKINQWFIKKLNDRNFKKF